MFWMSREAVGPFIRSPSRSEVNASLVRATPRQRPLLQVHLVRDRVGEEAGIVGAPAVLPGEDRLAARHLDQPDLDDDVGAVAADRPDQQAVGAELLPAIELHLVERGWRRDAAVGIS